MENSLIPEQVNFKEVQIQPYTPLQLSQLYGVSKKTMYAWISRVPDLGERLGKILTINQVTKIFLHLGTPQIEIKPSKQIK